MMHQDNYGIRNASIVDVIAELGESGDRPRLVISDPPWSYSQSVGAKNAADHYAGLPCSVISEHVRAAGRIALPNARLALWSTFPLLGEWMPEDVRPWTYKTGGAWVKTGRRIGMGYHWRGHAEPVLVYTKGSTGRPYETLRSGFDGPISKHSAKPIDWQRAWIRAWTKPGELVLDMYAGLGSVCAAAKMEGRRYVGAELDPERHAEAVENVAAAMAGPRLFQ